MFNLALLCACVVPLVQAKGDSWPVDRYKTEPFVNPRFKIDKSAGNTSPGYIFLGTVSPQFPGEVGPRIVTNEGELVWHGTQKPDPNYNFQAQTLHGAPVLSSWDGYLQGAHGVGRVNILDADYNLLHKVCLPDSEKHQIVTGRTYPRATCYLDKHESIMASSNSIIVTAYNATPADLSAFGGPKNGWVFDSLFYELELPSNKVLFKWSARDHVPLKKSNYIYPGNKLPSPATDAASAWDYFHINSVEKLEDGYLVNSRYTWSFYILGKDGKVKYTMEGSHGGDFKLEDDQTFFSWQHNARLHSKDGHKYSISLFDNDNVGNHLVHFKNTSSGYLFTLDTKKMTAKTDLHLTPSKPIYSPAEGSYQNLPNGHALIGYGQAPYFEEFDPQGNLVFSVQYDNDRGPAQHSYRVYRLPWTATPNTRPKAVSEAHGDTLHTWASWNGATECTHWNVYAGPSEKELKLVAKNVRRKGFETLHKLKKAGGKVKYVKVEALSKGGKKLSKSAPVLVADKG